MKTMNSLLNSPWPSPRRQRVSACSFCVFAPAVVFPSNEQCLSLFITSSTFPPLFIPGSLPFLIPLHQLLKVRISPTHFHLFLYSHIFLTFLFLGLEDTLHIYIIQQCCIKTASHPSSWITTDTCVCVLLSNVTMTCCAVTECSLGGEMNRDLGTEGEMVKGRRIEGGRRSLISFD